jgi:hypothetical protein
VLEQPPVGGTGRGDHGPQERRFVFVFINRPWAGKGGVLEWLCDQTGAPISYSALGGRFTFVPRIRFWAIQRHTEKEIIEIINRALERQGLRLVRHPDRFDLVPREPPPEKK